MTMSTALVIDVRMSAEHWWNDIERGKLKNSKQTLSQHLFVHQAHNDCPGMKHGSPQQVLRQTRNSPPRAQQCELPLLQFPITINL